MSWKTMSINLPLIKKLLSLKLPERDFAVFGSGPMFAHGIIREINDIDVITRGKAWEKIAKLGIVESASYGGSLVRLFGGEIEIFDKWGPGVWNIDKLIDGAEVIAGIRFVTLENVLRWKKLRSASKDKEHIKQIEAHLRKRGKVLKTPREIGIHYD